MAGRYDRGATWPGGLLLTGRRSRLALALLAVAVGLATLVILALPSPSEPPVTLTVPPPAVPAAPPPAVPAASPPAVPLPTAPAQPLPSPPAVAPSGPVLPAVVPPSRMPLPPRPAWQRYAASAVAIEGRPLVAVVIDDLGIDRRRTRRAMALPGPLTLAFLPYAGDLASQTLAAHDAGHELLLHMPMEPADLHIDPGPNALLVDLDGGELARRLRWNLDRFTGYVGINNHMGSRFTADRPGMAQVMAELHRRGLLFLDSKTSAASVGMALASEMGVPTAGRDVFLDNEISVAGVAAQLGLAEQHARRHGEVIVIGHPHDETLEMLERWLATNTEFAVVPLSQLIARRVAG